MQQQEWHSWNRIIVARIAQVEEPQDMFIDKVKPEEATIHSRVAAEREVEERRITETRQNHPGRKECDAQEGAGKRAQEKPGFALQKSATNQQVKHSRRNGNHDRQQPFKQQANSQCCPES